jgi:cytochrome c oxidase subunit 4
MAQHEHDGTHHPGPGEYVTIGAILAALTVMEVLLFYANAVPAVTIPSLLALTFLKFGLVVLWFMHLRFDHRLFRRLFVAGIAIAVVVYGITISTFYLGPS